MVDISENKKVLLRIPTALKNDLEKIAKQERRSLNQQVVVLLESATKQHRVAA
jgi:hypothetical protein